MQEATFEFGAACAVENSRAAKMLSTSTTGPMLSCFTNPCPSFVNHREAILVVHVDFVVQAICPPVEHVN